MVTQDAKRKAIDLAVAGLNKRFGTNTVIKLNEKKAIRGEVIPTSVPLFNYALGVGGVPKRRIIEIFGQESSGKTTLALDIVANCQKAGGVAAFVDAEHALDKEYTEKLGVNTDDLLLSQPDTAEDCLEVVESLVKAGIDLVVLDSVAAMVPSAEVKGDMGDSHMGLIARLMSQGLRKIGGATDSSGSCVIFINQIREKIGVVFGNPETTPGGRALKFWASVRIEVRSSKTKSGAYAGNASEQKIKIVKNKVAPPFREAIGTLVWGEGYDHYGNLMAAGEAFGIVEKHGAYYTFGDMRINRSIYNDAIDSTLRPLILETINEDIGVPVAIGAEVEGDDEKDKSSTFDPEEHI